jgi:hypothetical protein
MTKARKAEAAASYDGVTEEVITTAMHGLGAEAVCSMPHGWL